MTNSDDSNNRTDSPGKDPKDANQMTLSALKQNYVRTISAKVEVINQTWEALKLMPDDEVTYQLFHREAHMLAGTAATYGLLTIAGYAQNIELALPEWPPEDSGVLPLRQIESQLQQLTEVAGREASATQQTKTMLEHSQALSHVGDGKLVYLVDDDADFVSGLRIQLQAFGYEVDSFTELADFEAALQLKEPAAVVMDVMFKSSPAAGIEHISRLNAARKHPLTTVFISVREDMLSRLSAVRANGLGYFTKPLRVEHLVDALERLTHQRDEAPFSIVIVDDSKDQSAFTAGILQQAGMQTQEVNTPLELLNVLAEIPADLILMDLYMPDCSGLELSKVLRQIDAYVNIPIVFLSVELDLGKKLSALSLGADDFLSKPVEPWHLVSAVSSRVLRGRMIRKQSETDGLTGLINHSKCKQRLEIELARAQRQQTPLSFAMLDIDHFKHVNDRYGHPAGDRVLKSLANLFKQRLRTYDIIGRYGGEEFVVIFVNTDAASAWIIMDQLRILFSGIEHYSEEGNFCCSFSCGIASLPQCKDIATLCDEADKALYQAKKEGRNRIVSSTC